LISPDGPEPTTATGGFWRAPPGLAAGPPAPAAGELVALRQIPLELADLDRPPVVRADALALQLLRAHAAGDVRQRIAVLDQLQRRAKFTRAEQIEHLGDVDFHRASARVLRFAFDLDADFARPVFALLVAQGFEPDEQLDLARAVAEVHIAEIAAVDQTEIARAFLGRADVGRDRILTRPAVCESGEHRIASAEVGVERAHERPFALEREGPNETHQHRAHRVVTQQLFPEHRREGRAEFVAVKRRRDRLQAVGDKDVAEGARIAFEVPLEQRQLAGRHLMISASQSAAARAMRRSRSGVIVMRSHTPGITRATSWVLPRTTIFVFSKISGRF